MTAARPLLDHGLVARRRLALNLSRRALARALGVSPVVIAGIENAANHHELTLALIADLAEQLAVQPGDLLAPAPGPPPPAAPDDVRAEAALMHAGRLTTAEDLARAHGWTLARTRAALGALRERLHPTGLALTTSNGAYLLTHRHSALTDPEAQRLARARHARDGLRPNAARILQQLRAGAITTAWEASAANDDRVQLYALLKAGIARQAPNGQYQLSTDAAYSLAPAP